MALMINPIECKYRIRTPKQLKLYNKAGMEERLKMAETVKTKLAKEQNDINKSIQNSAKARTVVEKNLSKLQSFLNNIK